MQDLATTPGPFIAVIPVLPDGVNAVWCPEARTVIVREGLSPSSIGRYVGQALELVRQEAQTIALT